MYFGKVVASNVGALSLSLFVYDFLLCLYWRKKKSTLNGVLGWSQKTTRASASLVYSEAGLAVGLRNLHETKTCMSVCVLLRETFITCHNEEIN